MLKEPRPGRVKTGLGRDIGMTAAAWWFRHQCRRLLRELDDPRWRLVIAVSPDAEGRASRIWPAWRRAGVILARGWAAFSATCRPARW